MAAGSKGDARAMLLISGGIDSPVAGHLLQVQGLALDAIHFSIEPFTDDSPEEKSVACAERIGLGRLLVVPAGPAFAELTRKCDHALYFVLSKRLMLRVASEWARREGCGFLATGENLGQVSSQTLTNLSSIDAAAGVPVLRPLLCYDKMRIVELAERLDTFHVSKGPEMCDALGPDTPSTHAPLRAVLEEEAKVDVDALVADLVAKTRVRRVVAAPAA